MKIVRLGVLALAACGAPVGNVSFTTKGDGSVTEPIPADSPSKAGFVDGWSVKLKKTLMIIKETTLTDSTGKVIFKQPSGLLYDLNRAGPFPVQDATDLLAKKYAKVSYAIGFDPQFQIVNMDAATVPDAALMRNNSFGVYIEGTATKGTTSKEFQWGFATDTLYDDCSDAASGGAGVTVKAGATEAVELSIHADHLFLDSLTAESGKLRFDALANADKPVDGTITQDELKNVQLSAVPSMPYVVGGATEVKTLADFVLAASRNIGHYRGGGECTVKAR